MPMKTDLKNKWIEALKSGKFRKGYGSLNNSRNNSYCCLGVLCELQEIPKEVAVSGDPMGDSIYSFEVDHKTFKECHYLPTPYMNSLGFSNEDMTTLASLNDTSSDFADVINYIRDNM